MSREIEEFIRAFEECSLPVAEWTHQKHLIMALWYLVRHPRPEATRLIRDGIQRYNLNKGNRTGYHETITLAWAEVISRFLDGRNRRRAFNDLAEELIRTCGERDYLLRFYSKKTLLSAEARGQWVAPDLAPIEFSAE